VFPDLPIGGIIQSNYSNCNTSPTSIQA